MNKKVILLMAALCLLLPAHVAAQLPYNSINAVPGHISRTYDIREREDPDVELPSLITSGTNVVWDFSSLDLDVSPEETWYFEPASATPHHSAFPSANLVAWYENIFGGREYIYMNNSPFELRLLGGVFVEVEEPLVVNYCPSPFLIMDYPMGIGSGVQQLYNCPEWGGAVDTWTIMATGSIEYGSMAINNVVLWRSVFNGATFSDTSFFWTQYDNVLYPVARYNRNAWARLRFPISEAVLNTSELADPGITFDLYPNPATDVLTIRSGTLSDREVSIQIFDATGRSVVSRVPRRPGDTWDLDVSALPPGAYLVELRSDAGTMAQRRPFVKQ